MQIRLVFFAAFGADANHVGVGDRLDVDGFLQSFDEAPFRHCWGFEVDTAFMQPLECFLQHVVAHHGLRQLVHVFAVLRVRLQLDLGVGLDVLHVARCHMEYRLHGVGALALDECQRYAQQDDDKPHHDADAAVLL